MLVTEQRTWRETDEDEAIRGLAALGQEFPGIEVDLRWVSNSNGPGVVFFTARWEGRRVTCSSVDGIREGLLAR